MLTDQAVPRWLWRGLSSGLALSVVIVVGIAVGLGFGLADPPRAGPLLWQTDFKSGADGWIFYPPPQGSMAPGDGALVADFGSNNGDNYAAGLTAAPKSPFTLEVAGAARNGAAYGLVFGWQDPEHFSAVLINADGYAEAFRQVGSARQTWYAWQQWPYILVGGESNRVRADVGVDRVTVRVNDELLVETDAAPMSGLLGVLATSRDTGRVNFSWVRVWTDNQ